MILMQEGYCLFSLSSILGRLGRWYYWLISFFVFVMFCILYFYSVNCPGIFGRRVVYTFNRLVDNRDVREFWWQWKWEQKLLVFTYLSPVWNGNQSSEHNNMLLLILAHKHMLLIKFLSTPPHLHCISFTLKWISWNGIMPMCFI